MMFNFLRSRLFRMAGLGLIWCCSGLPLRAQDFVRGPFVQHATTNGIKILWETACLSRAQIEYGATPNLGVTIADDVLDTNHVAGLEGLLPDTRYYYRIASLCDTGAVVSPVESFSTLKSQGSIRFAVISDTAWSGLSYIVPPQAQLAEVLAGFRPDLVLHLGDIVNTGFNHDTVQTQFFNFFQPVLKKTPFYLAVGNHDLFPVSGALLDVTAPEFHKAYHLPTNSVDGTSRYYSFDHGDAHFICLFNPWFYVYDFNAQTDQYRWLIQDLAASAKPWKILFFHAPIATSSGHALDDYNYNQIPDQMEVMALLAPLARQYGIQMVFNGHDHSLHRYPPHEGLHFCVTAGGGQSLYTFAVPFAGIAKYWYLHHCLLVNISGDTMTLEAYGTDGTRFDTWTVQKALPPRQIYEAAWHTPDLMTESANDGDGNIIGQRFDLMGAPIYPRAGEFSNLGRIYVNNDARYLYVGWEQIMIQNDNNIFLFIDSPRNPGVSSMAGLGNGKIDPDGEGVDGLDCLENLAFTNFAPCIGCVLGDEYADGSWRAFSRTNLGLAVGQGIFRLDPGLSDVSGAHLQQFNLSPQTTGNSLSPSSALLEQNADYIQIAIPLRELGGAQPGELLKLGAVVGGMGFDPERQIRHLDTSVLGYSLSVLNPSQVLLEGVAVRLASPPNNDTDQDGSPDWLEQLAGTDPYDPQSNLWVKAQVVSNHQIQLYWPTVPGKRYQIDTTDDLSVGFVPLPDPTFPRTALSSNDAVRIDRKGESSPVTRFYRVRLLAD